MKAGFTHWLLSAARRVPESIALECEERSWTYSQLFTASFLLSRKLKSRGISSGSRVAIISQNSPAQVIAIHAVTLLNCVVTPINHRFSHEELKANLSLIDPELVVYDDTLELSSLSTVNTESLPLSSVELFPRKTVEWPEVNLPSDSTGVIFLTSGTTGTPKAVSLTWWNLASSAIASALNLGVDENDKWLTVLPLDHMGGFSILIRSAIYGTAVVLHRKFDASRAMHSIQSDDITMASLVPTMLRRLLNQGLSGENDLRAALIGGGPATQDLLEAAIEKGIPVCPTYGMTETSSQLTTLSKGEVKSRLGSSGKPLPMMQVKIIDRDGVKKETGQTGEIAVRGPNVTSGYLDATETNEGRLKNGWLLTGDYGYVDSDGYLYPVGRREDRIVSGGENISPAEVESVYRAHPAIQDICVFGIPDPEWDEIVVGAVILNNPEKNSVADLLKIRFENLAGFKHPKKLFTVKELPRTASGKVKRSSLRDRFSPE